MIVGDPSVLAIESQISEAYEQPSLMALGSFVIHVGGQPYGRQSPDGSILACSFGEIEDRIADRGTRIAPFSVEPDAGKIADAFLSCIYGETQKKAILAFRLLSSAGFSPRHWLIACGHLMATRLSTTVVAFFSLMLDLVFV